MRTRVAVALGMLVSALAAPAASEEVLPLPKQPGPYAEMCAALITIEWMGLRQKGVEPERQASLIDRAGRWLDRAESLAKAAGEGPDAVSGRIRGLGRVIGEAAVTPPNGAQEVSLATTLCKLQALDLQPSLNPP